MAEAVGVWGQLNFGVVLFVALLGVERAFERSYGNLLLRFSVVSIIGNMQTIQKVLSFCFSQCKNLTVVGIYAEQESGV